MAITIALAGNPNCGKTTMFNAINPPLILFRRSNGKVDVLRQYTYEDYRDRMD